jgi:hypothetical protein
MAYRPSQPIAAVPSKPAAGTWASIASKPKKTSLGIKRTPLRQWLDEAPIAKNTGADVLAKILDYVPFANQMRLWQTGDRSWHRSYKASIKSHGTTLTLDEEFHRELLLCYSPQYWDNRQRRPFPNLLKKFPIWLVFNRVILGNVLSLGYFDNNNVTYYFERFSASKGNYKNFDMIHPDERVYMDAVRALIWKSKHLLRIFETVSSHDWMFELLNHGDTERTSSSVGIESKTNVEKDGFNVLHTFKCHHTFKEHIPCYCRSCAVFLRGSGIYVIGFHELVGYRQLVGFGNLESIEKISIYRPDNPENVSQCFDVITLHSQSLPNLRIIEFTINHNQVTTFNAEMQEMASLMRNDRMTISIKACHLAGRSYDSDDASTYMEVVSEFLRNCISQE